MEDPTRRNVLGAAAIAGAAALAGSLPKAASASEMPDDAADAKLEREHVLACGFTEAEADCWMSLSQTAGKFFDLPKLLVMDDHEISHAIHVLQYRLMSRPAYRKYKTPPAPPEKK